MCPTGRRILSSRLSLTKCSKAFFILNGNTEKRPHRIRSAMSAPAGEGGKDATVSECSRLHKKKAVLKVIKLNQGQPYDF